MQCMTALHCARRHWAPLTQRAIVPSMHHAVHASESDAETCSTEPQYCEFIPSMQNLAMQMHTVPIGTQHGSREPQSCACTPGMRNLAMQMHCTVPAGTQHGSREPQCCACTLSLQNMAMQCIAPCPRGTQHGSREPQCCACTPRMQNLAMQMNCTVPAGTQHGFRESHSAEHALEACKTWQCKCIAPCQQARSTAPGSQCCACTPSMRNLAMQMHWTVPAGTQHGLREP